MYNELKSSGINVVRAPPQNARQSEVSAANHSDHTGIGVATTCPAAVCGQHTREEAAHAQLSVHVR